MKEVFNNILDEGEEIVEVFKPNKKKFWTSFSIAMCFLTIFAILFIGLPIAIPTAIESEPLHWLTYVIIFLSSFVASFLVFSIFARLYYKNRYYAYSNKRILIRGGIFGIDFKTLEYKALGALSVDVTLIDKMVKKNTGTIKFGSPSAPIGGASGNGNVANPYVFSHIEKPYDVLKDIKKQIDLDKKAK